MRPEDVPDDCGYLADKVLELRAARLTETTKETNDD